MGQRRDVIHILSAFFSGSTLLSSLLDCQPQIRALTEALFLWRAMAEDRSRSSPYCAFCQARCEQCDLFKFLQMHPQRNVYECVDEFYDHDSLAYADSSKQPIDLMAHWRLPPTSWGHKAIVLSKSPHALAYSYMEHDKRQQKAGEPDKDNLADIIEGWIETYRCIFRWLDGCQQRNTHLIDEWGSVYGGDPPRFNPEDVLIVRYPDLASKHNETLARICKQFQLEFDAERTAKPWDEPSNSHQIIVNSSIYAQVAGSDFFFEQEHSKDYLDGKYTGQNKKVFLDEKWRKDEHFLAKCERIYKCPHGSHELEALSLRLGHGTLDDLRRDIHAN